MALRFCDSFDHYTTTTQKWTVSGSTQISAGNGRFGTSAMQLNSWGTFIQVTLGSQPTWIVGVAWSSAAANGPLILSFIDSATTHISLNMTPSGVLSLLRGGTTLATGTTVVGGTGYRYIEAKVTIADSGGVAVVKIDGATEFNFSGDTRNGANASANIIKFSGSNIGNTTIRIDDLYICDGTGSTNNDFLGDVRVQAIFPTGNGNSSQLTGSDGNSTDNYLLVDETAPDSDTTFVESSNVGDKDTYAYGNLTPTTGTVYGIQMCPHVRKTDAGTRSIATVARLAGTEVDSADIALPSSYAYSFDVRETKPGGGAWTIADVNDAEFGLKVTA